MKRTQTNEHAMQLSVLAVLQSPNVPTSIPGLAPAVNALRIALDAVAEHALAQARHVLPAKTARRNAALADMEAAALTVAGMLLAHANENALPDLRIDAALHPTSFKVLRVAHRPRLAQRIHDLAQPLSVPLVRYGLDEHTLVDLQAKIDAANVEINEPRATIVARAAATQQLAVALKRASALIKERIDPMVYTLRDRAPEFYLAYRAARVVVDHRARRAAAPAPAPLQPTLETQPLAA